MTPRFSIARPELGEAEWQAVRAVIESGWVTQGPKVVEFERAVADFCGAEHAVAVSSCTAALHLSLVCAGVGPGDEVIVPSMSFIATANAVVHAGATPVFAEVDSDTYNLDLADTEARITPKTRAIMAAHQLGLPVDIDGFNALCSKHQLSFIEDAACAIGSSYRGAPIGSHSDFVCFSFHPRKLVTTGDGGMILTSSSEHAQRLRRLRHHGMTVSDLDRHEATDIVRETYDEVGYNYRLTDVQAAIGIEQLRRLPGIVARRRQLATSYDQALEQHKVIRVPVVPPEVKWNVQTYTVRLMGFDVTRRDSVMRTLLQDGIATRSGVMTSHRELAYTHGQAFDPLPKSEMASDTSIALPLHGGITEDDCREIAAALVVAVDALRN
ncbi:MAG: DegT/DnrJ/EryC1/StrS family aminotransferase [Acidimicrobiales bacterium]